MQDNVFQLQLDNFEGPLDLLLQLIQERKLDITEVALHEVTDEYIAYTRELTSQQGLESVTEFLVVAATLLDLKTARLLPRGDMVDPADLELLEARDLLFARLLQYRAFKTIAEQFAEWEQHAPRRYPRTVTPEERFLQILPPLELGVSVEEFALIAAVAFRPKPIPQISTTHVHIPTVSVEDQARIVLQTLQKLGAGKPMEFGKLVADCTQNITKVGRFLSLLELYRMQAINFQQSDPLGELYVEWSGHHVSGDELRRALGDTTTHIMEVHDDH